jgi:hypothetical protein
VHGRKLINERGRRTYLSRAQAGGRTPTVACDGAGYRNITITGK